MPSYMSGMFAELFPSAPKKVGGAKRDKSKAKATKKSRKKNRK